MATCTVQLHTCTLVIITHNLVIIFNTVEYQTTGLACAVAEQPNHCTRVVKKE